MATTWTIAIDWDRDGNFNGLYDDVTNRVIEANWFLGQRQLYSDVADDSMLRLTLRNDDKYFSPENVSSPLNGKLVPYRPIIVQSDDGVTVRTHYRGWVESLKPSVNQYGERTIIITAAGPMQFLKAAETSIALQENKRTDQIIATLVQEIVLPPSIDDAFILGYSRLGINTFLRSAGVSGQLDQGVITLTMAGDNWVQQGGSASGNETFDVYRAIEDVAAAERGRFLFSRGGDALFWNRDRLIDTTTIDAIFDDSMQNLAYVYGAPDELRNEIVVVCHPRTISASNTEVLWQLEGTIDVPQGQSVSVIARYRDNFGNRIGGRNVSVTGVTFSTGTGTVTITPQANSAELLITNTGTGMATLSACTVQGQKITDFGRMEAFVRDGLSVTLYGRRTLRMSLPAVDNLEDAESIAQFELERRKDPRGSVRELHLTSHGLNGGGHHAKQLGLTLGNKVVVRETQTAHDADYFIIGEAHRLSRGATLFETTWYLEPAIITRLTRYDKSNQDSDVALKGGGTVNDRLAQSFQIPIATSVNRVRLWLKKTGAPTGNLTAKFYIDSAGNPGSLVTSGTSDATVASTLTTSYDWVEFKFSTPPSLAAMTTYWLVLETSDSANASNYVVWGSDGSTPAYISGEMKSERTGSWVAENKDSCFEVYAA